MESKNWMEIINGERIQKKKKTPEFQKYSSKQMHCQQL